MTEHGKNGEIYNIANGDFRPLQEYVETVRNICGGGEVSYGEDPNPFVSLQPSMAKLKRDTGWYPTVGFEDGIKELLNEYQNFLHLIQI